VNSPTQIQAIAPAGAAGTVDVLVSNADGTSTPVAADRFLYQASVPTVTSLSPPSGPTSGGNQVVITGTNFLGVTAVTFGATPACHFTYTAAAPSAKAKGARTE